ncbi:MAG: hypothetical protein KDA05_02950 [Phycisphaerales bacterium]|nr:hypothetical protein [Phycisphaerales bacterium]MCB9841278.1 hypothetical protein [Phycisphaeraceae bacterium]
MSVTDERPSSRAGGLVLRCLTLVATGVLVAGCAASREPRAERHSTGAPPRPSPTTAPLALTVTSEPWSFGDAEGRLLRTPSYRILTTDDSPLVADRMPAFLEASLATYRTMFGPLPAPSAPLDVYLMATRPQWEALTRQTAGPRADIYLRIQRGGYSENGRAVFYNIGPRDTFAIAGHEGWHQYTQAVFREALPIWLEEGISVAMEGFRWDEQGEGRPVFLAWSNLERYDRLREVVISGRATGLETLLNQRPQDLLQDSSVATLDYYAQIWALTLFLRDAQGGRYRASLERMLRDAAEGRMVATVSAATSAREARWSAVNRLGDAPFRAYFGPVGDAAPAFDAFLRAMVRPGGRSAVLEGRSPE